MPNYLMFLNWLLFILIIWATRRLSTPTGKNRNTWIAVVGYLALHTLRLWANCNREFSACLDEHLYLYWYGFWLAL